MATPVQIEDNLALNANQVVHDFNDVRFVGY